MSPTALADPPAPAADRPAPEPEPPGRAGKDSTHYWYPPTGERYVRVSTVLAATESDSYLAAWYARMAGRFAVDNHALLAELIAGGPEGQAKAFELVAGQAKAIADLKADTGSYVHLVIERLIIYTKARGRLATMVDLPDLPPHLQGAEYDGQPLADVADWMLTGFTNFVADWNPEFAYAEMTVFNPDLKVGGTLDMIIVLRDVAVSADGTRLVYAKGRKLVLCVDTKTGKHYKRRWKAQVAAYRRMRRAQPVPMGDLVDMPATDAAAILHLRPEYANGYRLMLVAGRAEASAWNKFRRRVGLYFDDKAEKEKPGRVVYPPKPDGTMPPPRLDGLDGDGYGRVLKPLMAYGCVTVADVALFTRAEVLQIKGIGDKTIEDVARLLADEGLAFAGPGAPGEAA